MLTDNMTALLEKLNDKLGDDPEAMVIVESIYAELESREKQIEELEKSHKTLETQNLKLLKDNTKLTQNRVKAEPSYRATGSYSVGGSFREALERQVVTDTERDSLRSPNISSDGVRITEEAVRATPNIGRRRTAEVRFASVEEVEASAWNDNPWERGQPVVEFADEQPTVEVTLGNPNVTTRPESFAGAVPENIVPDSHIDPMEGIDGSDAVEELEQLMRDVAGLPNAEHINQQMRRRSEE